MSDWLIQKYIGIISSRLKHFKRKGPTLYNFRCPVCGDSTLNEHKARAYIYDKAGKSWFHCHNCNETMATANFIKYIDQNLFDEYTMEKLRENRTPQEVELDNFENKMTKPVFLKSGPLKGLKKVSQLSIHDPVKKYVELRKLPTPWHAKLFSCPKFKAFTNNLVPEKFSEESLIRDETRLIIPYFDHNKNCFAYNGRSIGESKVKYIKILLNTTSPHLFGMDTIDLNKTIYVTEGEFDTMFINNALATGGGDLISAIRTLSKDNVVIVYDNEPRSRRDNKKD